MPVDFSEQTLKQYSDFLSAGTPSPGGGSAAAMTAVLGISLGEMVANINSKKVKSNPQHAESKQRALNLGVIRSKLLNLVTKDAVVFEKLSKYWNDKSPLLEDALKNAASTPLEMCTLINEALNIASEEIDLTSAHLISDLSECGIILQAAFRSALFNIEINAKQIQDKEFTAEMRAAVVSLSASVDKTADILARSFKDKTS